MKGLLRTFFAVISVGTLTMNALAILTFFAISGDFSEVDWTHFLVSTPFSILVFILILKDLRKEDSISH